MNTTQTAPPAAHIAAVGGATKPGVELRPPGAEAPPVAAGTARPAAAPTVGVLARPSAVGALTSRSLGLATGTTATVSSALGLLGAEEAQTTVSGLAGGSGPAAVPADGRLTRSRPSATTSTGSSLPIIGGGELPAARWCCEVCGLFHGYGQCRPTSTTPRKAVTC